MSLDERDYMIERHRRLYEHTEEIPKRLRSLDEPSDSAKQLTTRLRKFREGHTYNSQNANAYSTYYQGRRSKKAVVPIGLFIGAIALTLFFFTHKRGEPIFPAFSNDYRPAITKDQLQAAGIMRREH
ncbi:hypothetical protein [Methylogaea oryzae]|uniref:Uncharacterized protein n=1 Tax=Methylogaea oryzae TaxID=1295382 RepID=A0A8D4VRL8_9GAMM|nr:hypothetical protein [Methylogaea oryzae]BBL72576.1 hypothetical protein MoryE10_31820 [Methylogaea oryzae]